MRRKILLLTLFAVFSIPAFKPALGFQLRDDLQLTGELETSVGLYYLRPKKHLAVDFPLYFQTGLFYDGGQLESAVSVSFRQELDIGETYIKGGSDYSYLKIGYFSEEWGKGYSVSTLRVLNRRDDRYPSNIFYRKKYRPEPAMIFTFGEQDLYQQIVLSNSTDNITSIKNTGIGFRGISVRDNSEFSIGYFSRIGYFPALIFTTVEDTSPGQRVWLDFGFDYYKNKPPVWYSSLGFSRELPEAVLTAEYVIDGHNTYFFAEEEMSVNEAALFDIKIFLHVPDLSSAFNAAFVIEAQKDFLFEPGAYFFIGKRGKYFSPREGDNDDELYLKLSYSF
jgi:hypothetical protein